MKSLTIALATAKEAIRQPAFFVLAFIASASLIASIFVSYFTFGEDIKMYKDTGLTTISFVGLLLALLTASSSVAEEIEGKTAITLLSKPINRRQFILGKFLGIELGVLALFALGNSSDAFLLLRARDLGVAAALIPLLWAALHVSKMVWSVIGGRMSDRAGPRVAIVAGWMVYAAVYAGFAFVSSAWMAWMLFIIYGVYFGLAEGAEKALVADLVRPEQRGTAYGLYNLAFGVTVFPASLLMGGLWSLRGAQTAFLVSAGLGAISALPLLTFVEMKPTNTA